MLEIKTLDVPGYENVVEITNRDAGMHGFIALHDTTLGPALGGLRIYPYKNTEDALNDVLRLAKGMTYKSAVAETGLGGGKSVLIADPKTQKTDRLLLAFAEALNTMEGRYIVAEDVGSSVEDMLVIHKRSKYVAALPTEKSSGDPSRFTAHGLFLGMQAVGMKLWGSPSLEHKVIAIQGLGHVGSKLAKFLFWEGAQLIVTDLDPAIPREFRLKYGATEAKPGRFLETECDILAPCALGGVFTPGTIPSLRCKAILGAANNQLLTEEDGRRLMERGILYAPDFVANAGGIINAAAEFEPEGYHPAASLHKVNKIYRILLEVFEKGEIARKPTNLIADEMAEYNLSHLIGKRQTPIEFK